MPIISIILLVVAVACAAVAVDVRHSKRGTDIFGSFEHVNWTKTLALKFAFGLAAALCLWGAGVLAGWWAL